MTDTTHVERDKFRKVSYFSERKLNRRKKYSDYFIDDDGCLYDKFCEMQQHGYSINDIIEDIAYDLATRPSQLNYSNYMASRPIEPQTWCCNN